MLQLHEGHHHHPSIEGRQQVADSIWAQEHITLVTVGIDIGSSTSHLSLPRFICSDERSLYPHVMKW